jgi:hypothetical protein
MKPLPRRAFLGAELPADDEAFTPSGTQIAAVTAGGMADRAGVRAGDTIVTLADLPVRSFAELSAALRRAGAGSSTELRFARGAAVHVSAADVVPCPLEEIEGVGVGYGELATSGVLLRTIATRVPEPRAVILASPDLACESVEAESPIAELAHGWARAGFDTLRFDRRGVGDSEGGPCSALDFSTELSDTAAALVLARTRAREREVPLVVFGHGVGGLVAASLAGEHHVHGIITFGTPAARWLACLADTTRRLGQLRGDPPEAIERAARELVETALRSGTSGRAAAYHAQLEAIEPAALWARVRAPVLVVRGGHDWVVREEDQARVASLVAGTASVIDLPGLDHVLGWHDSREASLRDYGAGRFDASIVRATAEWIERL